MMEQPYSNKLERDENGRFIKGFSSWKGKKRKPFTKEWKARMGYKKEKHPLWGKKRSDEVKEKCRIAQLGKKGNQYGKYGENSANWKGGRTKIHQLIRNCFEYRQWRSDVFSRDNFVCQDCGIKGGYLEAHHIKSFALILDEFSIKNISDAIKCSELWNINNGITLCSSCHKKINRFHGKK